MHGNGCGFRPPSQHVETRFQEERKEEEKRLGRTCLSFKPSNKTSSMIVSLGILPPLPSCSVKSRSRGSYAIPPPPRKAEPA